MEYYGRLIRLNAEKDTVRALGREKKPRRFGLLLGVRARLSDPLNKTQHGRRIYGRGWDTVGSQPARRRKNYAPNGARITGHSQGDYMHVAREKAYRVVEKSMK